MTAVRERGATVSARLRRALDELLPAAGHARPVEVSSEFVRERSSFPLERLTVTLADGSELRLAFKRLERRGLDPQARLSKPGFLFDAAREPLVYSTVLASAPLGPPRYLGSLASEGGRGRWLFVEWVAGRELYQVGERSAWSRAARWLARMHAALAPDLDRHASEARLLDHDAAHCARWAARAARFARAERPGSVSDRFLGSLRKRYERVAEELAALPRTLVHGDFYASNVLVGEGEDTRVTAVDWEMAGAGPGLLDLAALTSGGWSESERAELVSAYRSVEQAPPFCTRDFELVRLHHAVQRLGWAPQSWRPPPAHRHDWLDEAMTLAERIGV